MLRLVRRAKGTFGFLFLLLLVFSLVCATLLSQKAAATSISDNFNRADGGLGSNWTTVTGANAPQITSNVLVPGAPGALNAAFWSADTFGNDQFVQANMPNSTGSEQGPGIAVRMANSRGYFLWYGNAPNTVTIWRMDSASSWTELVSSSTLTVSGSDMWKFVAQGTTLKAYQNGTLVAQVTDTAYASGSPGVWMYNGLNQIDNWSAGDATFAVGGSVAGLSGTVTLQNNGGNTLSVSANGSFAFSTKLLTGDTYDVTVKSYPTWQTCAVSNATGTVTTSDVSDISVSCANSPPVTSASDTFNTADGPVDPNWTDMAEGGLFVSSNEVIGTNGPGGISGEIRTEEAYTSNQYSTIEVSATPLSGSQWIGPMVREQSNGDLYNALYDWNNGSPYVQIFKRIGGTWTGLNAYTSGVLAAGTKIELEAIGSDLIVYINGTERITSYDATLTGGAPGILAYQTPTADNWSGGNAPDFVVNYLSTDANGVDTYDVISETNGPGAQKLRVLRPTSPAAGTKHNFIYTMPVTAGLDTGYGDGLDTIQSLNAQNQYNLTVVEPTFGVEPWYADNPLNTNAQQETYVTTQLVPWVKANLATTGYEQSWLIGFSKSGIGSMDLFLKHPDLFTLEAAWDWPADISSYDQFGGVGGSSANSYGTDANFQANYRLTSVFMDAHKSPFLINNRIWIGGYNAFQTDVADFDTLLTGEGMAHTTETPTSMLHRWDSGWVPLALAALHQDSVNLPDITPPTVTSFSIPVTSASFIVPVTSFSAKDDTAVTGYKITTSSTLPSASESGWSTTPPTSFVVASSENVTLYAWAKDAAGNVSAPASASVFVSAVPADTNHAVLSGTSYTPTVTVSNNPAAPQAKLAAPTSSSKQTPSEVSVPSKTPQHQSKTVQLVAASGAVVVSVFAVLGWLIKLRN